MNRKLIYIIIFLCGFTVFSQESENKKTKTYKKRVLESTEVEFLSSYYSQDGKNAAVSGGIGDENLTNTVGNVVVSIPLNADDILAIDAGISAYTSASSSNLNPFDSNSAADPFVASTGASKADELISLKASYSHSSDDRNTIWGVHASLADEHDYSSLGFGGSFTKLLNEKNTELSINANVFLDNWKVLYPYELGGPGGDPEETIVPPFDINDFADRVSGNANYSPFFTPYEETKRNSYTLGLGFSQIINKRMQGSINVDFTQQQGQLGNHMQRVYFSDVDGTFIDNFRLADDVERLPDTRFKVAIGGRLNYYISEMFSLRSFYRYYFDDWGIQAHTLSLEVPVKLGKFTFYPSYRFYTQTAADYFAPYATHISTNEFYTSDYDLSKYNANQFGIGVSYTDPLNKFRIGRFRLKSIDFNYNNYTRNTGLKAGIFTLGIKFNVHK